MGDRTPAYRRLCAALRASILEGRLRPGSKLPATRLLAKQHRLSRGTIVTAFEQMKAEGYVTGRMGSGTYVNMILPDALLRVSGPPRPAITTPAPPRRLSEAGTRVQPFPPTRLTPPRAFRANQPALDMFPTTVWAQVASRCLRRASANLLRGCPPFGYPPLQKAIAHYLTTSRGVTCVPEQVAIVSGVQEALDLAGRLFLNSGDPVCMENPGYVGAARVFEALGARVIDVPLDGEGMTVPGAGAHHARLAYVTPAHQFPLGVCMTLPRRLALLDWARRSGALIFEDDYDSEYRYAGSPVPALQGLDRHGSVLFAGSFSKVLFPAIRMGYLVVPADLIDRVAAMKSAASRFVPLLDQSVLCEFITEGHFGRHLRRMRSVYAERLAVLQASATQRLSGLLHLSDVEAGLQTSGWLVGNTDGVTAAAAAAERGVEAIPLSRYSRTPLERDGLLLGFAAVDGREIQRGVRELAIALERCRGRR